MVSIPKKGEVANWMLYILCTAIVSLAAATAYLYREGQAANREHALELANCQKEIREAHAVFTRYMVIKDSIATAQQLELNRLNRKIRKR